MKSIDIFVAGAKNLDEYRDTLKILANELNVENKLKDKNVLVRMCDYKDIGDNQKDYDAFITHSAAGLFAIVVDDFGVETQKELKLAAQRFAKNKRSMVKVFIKKSADKEKMELIYNFIKLILGEGQYGEEFKDVTEFKSRAKKYLKDYIREAHRKEKSNNKLRKVGIAVASIIMAILGFLVSWIVPENSILLFVGGGSAKNMIEKSAGIVLKNRAETMVVDMPSGNTWPLIIEDLLYRKSKGDLRYKLIAMSAAQATEADFVVDENENATQLGAVIEILVGYDDLVLYVDSIVAKERGFEQIITKKQLSELLKDCKNNNWNVFATRKNSGTFMSYQALADFDIETLNTLIYSDKLKIKDVCRVSNKPVENPVILLGSQYYAASDIQEQNVVQLRIYANEQTREIVRKSIYLYFASEIISSDELRLDESVETFLRELAPKVSVDGKSLDSLLNVKIKDGKVKRGIANGRLLININELEDF